MPTVVDVDVRVLEVLETVLDFVWVVLLEVCVEPQFHHLAMGFSGTPNNVTLLW